MAMNENKYSYDAPFGIIRWGACEFGGYLLPMITLMGREPKNANIAYLLVVKYRQPCLMKEDAETIAKQDFDKCCSVIATVTDPEEQARRFINKLLEAHYFPPPEQYPAWEDEWIISGFKPISRTAKVQ